MKLRKGATLTAMQQRLHDMLSRYRDIPIYALYAALYDPDNQSALNIKGTSEERRREQQRVAAHISRINDKLDGLKIVPGELKRTYRVIVVPKG